MPKEVTKVKTGGLGLPGEDLSAGRRRRAMRAVERKLIWIAVHVDCQHFAIRVPHSHFQEPLPTTKSTSEGRGKKG